MSQALGMPVSSSSTTTANSSGSGHAWQRAGPIRAPHTLAMDSRGRLFVGDRGNNRIQVFDQDGKLLAVLVAVRRPSGIFIDQHDILYSCRFGIARQGGLRPSSRVEARIASATPADGTVTAFIPDTESDQEDMATTGARHHRGWSGNIYSAEVGHRRS